MHTGKELHGVSTRQMEDLVKTLMWFWGNLHQRWRSAIEDEYGLDAALRSELRIIGDVGKSHAKRIKGIFGIEKGIPGFIRAFEFAPENFLEGFEVVEQTEKYVIFRNPSCSAQRARLKWGKAEYPCKETGILYFTAFAQEIDPNAKLDCIVCPPDAHLDDCWCKWKLEVL